MIRPVFLLLAIGALALGACNRRADNGPVVASLIGGNLQRQDGARGATSFASRVVMNATAQGLVRFDAGGQIEPGLAERWTVIDNGMSYIFRLREAEWGDGTKVDAQQVIRALKRQFARESRNPLAPFLTAIGEVVEMTPEVIEIRLKHPRPDLLKLFAQPEMAIFRVRPPGGSGPYRFLRNTGIYALLRPAFDPNRIDPEDVAQPDAQQDVELIAERSARAVTRFADHRSDAVLGGTFVDWPLVPLSGIAPANLKVDPAAGLFGIAIERRTGFLADAENRAALAEVIDRDAIVAAYAQGWASTEQILPEQLDSGAPPATAPWQALSGPDRHAAGRQAVRKWTKANPGPIKLSLALPAGPGATILYGFVAASFRSLGVDVERVPLGAEADLRLVDIVAPYDSARWYLATACAACDDTITAQLDAARNATTLAERAQQIAAADAAIAADTPFIAIARPLRWSLVAIRLRGWQANSRAWHPLNHLRGDPS